MGDYFYLMRISIRHLLIPLALFTLSGCEDAPEKPIVVEEIPELYGTFSSTLTPSDTIKLNSIIERHFANFQLDTNVFFDSHERLTQEQVFEFYKSRSYRPIWINSFLSDSANASMANLNIHGLSASDYNWEEIEEKKNKLLLTESKGQLEAFSDYELRLTHAFLKIGNHLTYGKLDPSEYHYSWNLPKTIVDVENQDQLAKSLEKQSTEDYLANREPDNVYYRNLSKHLSRYSEYANGNSWSDINFSQFEQRKLEPGNIDPIVPDLRKRLFAEGYIDSVQLEKTDSLYKNEIVDAVKEYQRLHGLNNDGVIGKRTLASFNVSAEERLSQIIINLERLKWFVGNLKDDYILVNVAQYELYAHLNNETWASHVIVGKNSTKTPMFTANMKYVVFNPVWTQPYSIASKETLPHLKEDSLYLQKHNMIILDHDRNEVDPSGIDWNQFTQKTFPYVVRQLPGNTNSLGRIKFLFPNDHYIYLHDTPSRNLFRTDGRSYSHGCIRLNNPKELARRILNDSIHWNMDSIQATLDSLETVTVALEKQFPVYIIYASAFSNTEGEVFFFNDSYKFDEAMRNSLTPSLWVKKD